MIDGKVVAVHEKALPLPAPTIKAQKEHAVSWMLRTLKESEEKITLIPVGAMTNIATVLRMDPSVKEHIEEIICMGGGVSNAEDELLLAPLIELVKKGSFDKSMPTRLVRASLGNDAGVVGAALLCNSL